MDATRLPLPSTPFTSGDACRPASNLSCRPCPPAISSTLASSRNPNAKVILARGALPPSFADEGHAAYYQLHPTGTCLPKKQKKKNKDEATKVEAKQLKKKIRRLQGLLRAFGDEPSNSFVDHQLLLTETAKNMLERLQQVMALEEAARARRKGERAVKRKAADVSSSSSSSESSDGEGQGMNVLDMSRGALVTDANKSFPHLGIVGMDDATMDSMLHAGNDDDDRRDVDTKELEIEVCIGSKCQRSGALLVKEELERQMVVDGRGGTVAGCKCMGRCKEGPNVRLSAPNSHISSVCTGVSLDNITSHLSSFLHPHPLPL